jgi:hypothetical protein
MSRRQNVFRRVQVAVLLGAATGTGPLPVVQPEGFDSATRRAAFACRLKTICLCAVGADARGTCEAFAGILRSRHQQSLAPAACCDEVGRGLVEEVLARINDPGLKRGHFEALPPAM